MFKKPLKVSNQSLLGGKDKKTLKKDLSVHFHVKSIEHFFDSNEKIYCNKMQGSKIVLYSTETFPAIVDSTGKGTYFPTLYLAQAYPKMLEPVCINPGVSNFIFNGANLMWPGVRNPENMGDFKADDVRVILADSNKPIAIGAMGCGKDEMKSNNLQGVAVFVLHILEDKLWDLGPKVSLDIVFTGEEKPTIIQEKVKQEEIKNEEEDEEEDDEEDEDQLANLAALVKKGKVKEENIEEIPKKPVVKEKPRPEPSKKAQKEVFSDEEDDDKKKKGKKKGKAPKKDKEDDLKEKEVFSDDEDDDKKKKGKKKGKPTKKEDDSKEAKKEATKQKTEKDTKKTGKKKPKKEIEDEEEEEEENENEKDEDLEEDPEKEGPTEPSIPIKIMDEYIYEAFMNAIRMSVTEKDLPMDSSSFYASHMLLCKKENILIDLKNSSYKKIGKFFQSMAKLNLIEYKEAKKGTSPQITKINRSNEKYEKWEPTIGKIGSKKSEEEKNNNDGKWPKVLIEDLFKPKDSLKQIFAEDKEKKIDNLYTIEEARNILQEYVKKNCKLEKKFILMDPYLCSLFPPLKTEEEETKEIKEEKNQGKKEDEGEIEAEIKKKPKRVAKTEAANQISKDDLLQRYEDYLIKWHRITNLETKKGEIKMGSFKAVSITAEKAHNKNITKITGLEPFCFDLNDLSSQFQLKFACSVSIHDLPGKNTGKELVVHGNFLQDIIDFLSNECKVDKKHIVSLNKLEKKKEKKIFK